MAASSLCSLSLCVASSSCSSFRSAASVSAWERTETYSPAAMDIAPATSAAAPATRTPPRFPWAAATPRTRLAVERMPSSAPRTAARNQPTRPVRCLSASRRRMARALAGGGAPFGGDGASALVGHQAGAALAFFRRDRGWILAKLGAHRHRLGHGRPGGDGVEPALHVREFAEVDAAHVGVGHPRIADHVGDRVFAGGQPFLVVQAKVHDAVEPVGFVVEALHRVSEVAVVLVHGGAAEVALLAELGALVAGLPVHPLGDLVFRMRLLRPEHPALFSEIHHDRAGF